MYAAVIVLTAILASITGAAPSVQHGGHGPKKNAVGNQKVGDVCGNGNQVKCCNKKVQNHAGGLLGDLDLLDLQCNDVDVPVIGVTNLIKEKCKMQAVCCGQINQNGLINAGCTPLEL
ncbi:hypothetical protein HIM_05812 [Hirsutella minnesotensis 3608]|uniref:Hydrophobin n=1 Tax=Hirsutella minnesotensis 3608 TaxID=1043627 RepID=A0A0F7ZP12_9HYPO|nr:hypothetical protein HIM_05812 [Hirsutella minnesotensis 3608]